MRLLYTGIFLFFLLMGCAPNEQLVVIPGVVTETIILPLNKDFEVATGIHLEFSSLPSAKMTNAFYRKVRPSVIETINTQSPSWDIPQMHSPGYDTSRLATLNTKAFCEQFKKLIEKDLGKISILDCNLTRIEKRFMSDI